MCLFEPRDMSKEMWTISTASCPHTIGFLWIMDLVYLTHCGFMVLRSYFVFLHCSSLPLLCLLSCCCKVCHSPARELPFSQLFLSGCVQRWGPLWSMRLLCRPCKCGLHHSFRPPPKQTLGGEHVSRPLARAEHNGIARAAGATLRE